jgi:hypothetical protein
MPSKKAKDIEEALRRVAPLIPWADAEPIRTAAGQKRFKSFPPSISIWLSLVAHIRHQHTDYDKLLDQGTDGDTARYLVISDINDQLAEWGCSRQVTLEE